MTYSIVARDPESGELGVAVQTGWFAVGSIVTWAEPGVGAVATQSFAEVSYGPLGLDLMRAGKSAPDALRALLAVDEGLGLRQVAMVDPGRARGHPHGDSMGGGRRARRRRGRVRSGQHDGAGHGMGRHAGSLRQSRGTVVARPPRGCSVGCRRGRRRHAGPAICHAPRGLRRPVPTTVETTDRRPGR